MVNLKGKTMIQRVYEGVKKSQKLSEVVVATDDQRIFDEVIRFGGKVQMTSQLHTNGTDRCGELAQRMEADIIINIQGDEPLVDYRQLDQLCEAFDDERVAIATLGIKSFSEADSKNSNRVKIVLDDQFNALYFSRSPIPNTSNASPEVAEKINFYRHIGLYAYRKETLMELVKLKKTLLEQAESLEQLRWLYNGYDIRVVETRIETPNIDAPEDVKNVLRAI
jgi:3-deoxy-manno-octulosonate cytidylyltransferase (CMP-KDO synthetase)